MRHLYAIAVDADAVRRVAPTNSQLIDAGPHVLAKARDLGVADNDLKIVEADN